MVGTKAGGGMGGGGENAMVSEGKWWIKTCARDSRFKKRNKKLDQHVGFNFN